MAETFGKSESGGSFGVTKSNFKQKKIIFLACYDIFRIITRGGTVAALHNARELNQLTAMGIKKLNKGS